MKKKILTLTLLAGSISAMAQYQLPNSDFESDFVEAYKHEKKSFGKWKTDASYTEPLNWHGYATLQASAESARTGDKLTSSVDVRDGKINDTKSTKCICITTTAIVGIKANGVLTTGRIYNKNMNIWDVNNPKINFNQSDPSFDISSAEESKNTSKTTYPQNRNYAQRFQGKPDLFTAWVNYIPKNTSDRASVNAVIHTNARYQDPEDVSYESVKVAAAKNDNIAKNGWEKLEIPFDYSVGTSDTPAYILVTFTTNKTPGGGSDGDRLYVDDIAMVYYNDLKTLTYNGENILSRATGSDNVKTINCEDICYETTGTLIAEQRGQGAKITISKYDENTGIYTIVVEANDISVNPTNKTTYNIQFKKPVKINTTSNIVTTAGKANVWMTRNFAQGWNTVCLPFNTSATELGATTVQKFASADANSISFEKVTDGSIEANVPYLVYFTAAKSHNPLKVVKDLQASNAKTVSFGAYTFSGNYTANMNMNGKYGVADFNGVQKLRIGGASATLPAGCAYFTTANNANGMLIRLDGGNTTGILDVNTGVVVENTTVYNLQGVKVSNNGTAGLPAGIYVMGGKKVIVK